MKIILTTYENNTVYSIYTEKYGKEHHLGYINAKEINDLLPKNLKEKYESIQKPCPEQESMSKAIGEMIQMDIDRGVEPTLD